MSLYLLKTIIEKLWHQTLTILASFSRVGNALFDSGNHTGAIEYYDKVLMMNPNDTSALHNKAKSLHILGNYTGSIEYYDKVLAANPNDTEVLVEIAANFDALGNYTEAIKYLDKALGIDPNHTTALNNKGVVLYEGYTIQEICRQVITCMQIII